MRLPLVKTLRSLCIWACLQALGLSRRGCRARGDASFAEAEQWVSTNWACPCHRTGVSSVAEPVFGEPVFGGVCEVMSATARPAAEIWAARVTDWPPDPPYAAHLVQHPSR